VFNFSNNFWNGVHSNTPIQNLTYTLHEIYYSLLVYLTQKLAIMSVSNRYSTLTATHDKVSAWAGIGSALSALYTQLKLPSSSIAILAI
ncbi:hypothetical protein C8R44DRAFT_579481, partial [Mycena epipterygia]